MPNKAEKERRWKLIQEYNEKNQKHNEIIKKNTEEPKYEINLFEFVIVGIEINELDGLMDIICYKDNYNDVYINNGMGFDIKEPNQSICHFFSVKPLDINAFEVFTKDIKLFRFVSTIGLIMYINHDNNEIEIYNYYKEKTRALFKYKEIKKLDYDENKIKKALYTHLWEVNM